MNETSEDDESMCIELQHNQSLIDSDHDQLNAATVQMEHVLTQYNSGDYKDDSDGGDDRSISDNPTKFGDDLPDQSYQQHKWRNLFLNAFFYGRFGIFIQTLMLLMISLSYCVAQLYNTKLQLIRKCEPKSREEIWQHSYENSLIDGEIVMTAESQFGHSSEHCWTTKAIDTNTAQLWYSNVYISKRIDEVINTACVLYGLIAFYCSCVILYNLFTVIMDIIYVANNKLHTKSKKYSHYQSQQLNQQQKEPQLKRLCKTLHQIWVKYMANDTSGWIVVCFFNELLEIVVQSQALLLYNGYNIFDPEHKNDVYLANKSHFILLFTAILCFNCFGSGILWLSYSTAPKQCYGILFKLLLFLVDELSDFFYIIFPFIVVLTDNYNQNKDLNIENVLVLLGQLNINNSVLKFIASFVPLFFLSSKSLLMVRSTNNELINQYYKQWKFINDITKQKDDKLALHQAKLNGYNVAINDELYNSQGKLKIDARKMTSNFNWIAGGDVRDDTDKGIAFKTFTKRIIVIFISLTYVVYAIILLCLVIIYMDKSESFCNGIAESTYYINATYNEKTNLTSQQVNMLQNYPELFFWNNCLYKVFPFTRHDKYKCQCRVFVINWNDLLSTNHERDIYFNLAQNEILISMLENWIMLEKFRTVGNANEYYLGVTLKSSMFKALHMKAFEWKNIKIDNIHNNSISSWKRLEYLKFEQCSFEHNIPNDFAKLKELKYLSFRENNMRFVPDSICNLTQLQVLDLYFETQITSIPQCVSNLLELNQLVVDACLNLQHVPLSIFRLPKLMVLSLFKATITYQSFLQYNLPTNWSATDLNDSDLVSEWFNDNFDTHDLTQTEYWLSSNPICDETMLPTKLQHFINNTCDYFCEINPDHDALNTLCPPLLFGDGRCDLRCNSAGCGWDFGDCVQLCYAEEISNCTHDKLMNDVCDPECNNQYCSGYVYGLGVNDNFESPIISRPSNKNADNFNCIRNLTHINDEIVCVSNSLYVTNPTDCRSAWIGDNECDDACRTDECAQDGNDCDETCIDDKICAKIYEGWLWLTGYDVYYINSTNFCATMYPIAVDRLGDKQYHPIDCREVVDRDDYNKDGFINFREFVSLAYSFFGGWREKGLQLNCSQCVGMEKYNISP